MAHHHANDKLDDPLVLWELEEIETAIARERANKQGFFAFTKTKGNREASWSVHTRFIRKLTSPAQVTVS